jgi:hypothetical protein
MPFFIRLTVDNELLDFRFLSFNGYHSNFAYHILILLLLGAGVVSSKIFPFWL